MTVTKLDLKVTADAKAAVAGLKPLTTSLEGVTKTADKTESALNDLGQSHKVNINDAAVENARKEISRLRNEMRRKLSVDATADTRDAQRRIRQLQSSIRTLDRQDPVISVRADTKQAEGSLHALSGSIKGALAGVAATTVAKGLFGAALGADQFTNNLKGMATVLGQVEATEFSTWIEDNADALNLSKSAAAEAGKAFAVYAKAVQDAGGDASDFTVGLTELSTELAAFSGADPAEVISALGGALRGEYDPLERFGIALKAVDVEAKAAEMGLAAVGEEMSASARIIATNALLMEKGAFAMGSVERNADSLTSKMSDLKQESADLAKVVGDDLGPGLKDTADAANFLIGKVAGLTKAWADFRAESRKASTDGESDFKDIVGLFTATGLELPQQAWDHLPWRIDDVEVAATKQSLEGMTVPVLQLVSAQESMARSGVNVGQSLEEQNAELEKYKSALSGVADAFTDIGKNERTELQFEVDQDNLREEIAAAFKGKKPVKFPKNGIDMSDVELLPNAAQDQLLRLSDFVQQGLERGAQLAEIDPGFDPAAFEKELRGETVKLLVDGGMKPGAAKKLIDELLLGTKDAKVEIFADLTKAIQELNEFLNPPDPLIVPVGADTSSGRAAGEALNTYLTTGVTKPVYANTDPAYAAGGVLDTYLSNPVSKQVDVWINWPTIPQGYQDIMNGVYAGSTSALPGGGTAIVPQLFGQDAATVAGLRGVSTRAVALGPSGVQQGSTAATKQGTVTQLAPRQVPIKVYLDGAEIADHLTLKASRLATASSVRRRA